MIKWMAVSVPVQRIRRSVQRRCRQWGRWAALVVAGYVLVILGLWWSAPAGPQALDLTTPLESNRPEALQRVPEGLRIRFDNPATVHFTLPFHSKTWMQKLRLRFAGHTPRNIDTIRVYYGIPGRLFADKRSTVVPVVKGGLVFDFPLRNDRYESLRIEFQGSRRQAQALLVGVEVLPRAVVDYPLVPYLVALALCPLVILPGLLIHALLDRQGNGEVFLYRFFSYTLVFYFMGYLALAAGIAAGTAAYGWWVVAALALLGAGLVSWHRRRDRFGRVRELVSMTRAELLLYTALVVMAVWLVSYDTPLPFQNLHWQSISGPKTYGAFHAHDNYFQFANGRVIADNLPFSAEYGNRRLLYYPQDREILPGVEYAVFRKAAAMFSPYLGNSYFFYTMLGIAFNVMILFPLIVFARRYVPGINLYLIVFLVYANAVFLVQSYLTWFKFAGGALLISGFLALLADHRRLSHWAFAGLAFGLASSMHPAVAIGLPLYGLWMLVRCLRDPGGLPWRGWSGPLLLGTLFVLINLPWKIVKARYLGPDHDLLATYFFNGYFDPSGVLASARLFFENIPLSEQWSYRLGRLWEALRIAFFPQLVEVFTQQGWRAGLGQWTRMEIGYTAFLYYPAAFFLATAALWRPLTGGSRPFAALRHVGELRWVIALGLLTQVLFILAAYGRHAPDISWVQPYGVTAMVHTALILLLFRTPPVWFNAYRGFAAFNIYRLVAAWP